MKLLCSACLLFIAEVALAQDELIAYVPRKHIERTADENTIQLTSTTTPGVYQLALPEGTLFVDVLDPRGSPLSPQPPMSEGTIDVRGLRASTYTLRAHTSTGIRIRRFALMGEGASLWAIDAEPVR
jgi:hypothetical protein